MSFVESSGVLVHNCGFPNTDYALMFISTSTSIFSILARPVDGNRCNVSALDWKTESNGAITLVKFTGTATVNWIAIG